jgi:hypothetical protein
MEHDQHKQLMQSVTTGLKHRTKFFFLFTIFSSQSYNINSKENDQNEKTATADEHCCDKTGRRRKR